MWECVEMEERNTSKQQPGYDGLCNYAQKITSCFGLDGKMGNHKKAPGDVVILVWSLYLQKQTFDLFFLCDVDLCLCSSLVLCMCGSVCVECMISCVKASTACMIFRGQWLSAAE